MSGDVVLTAIALAAALIARGSGGGSVAMRFRAVATLACALLAARLARAIWPEVSGALVVELLVAAWLPFAGLRLSEELVRRHAPKPLKLFVFGGALVFTFVALGIAPFFGTAASLALAAFQTLALVGMIVVLLRERGEVAPADRAAISTLALAFALVIPLAASDFTVVYASLPVRGGVFAVLLLVLTTSLLAAGRATVTALLTDIGVMTAAALLTVAIAGNQSGIAVSGAVAGIAAVALLLERRRFSQSEQASLVTALSTLPDDADRATVRASHPLLANAPLIDDAALTMLPPLAISALARLRVANGTSGDADADGAARELLDALGATHLLLWSGDPPQFLAIAAGPLADAGRQAELDMAARLLVGAKS